MIMISKHHKNQAQNQNQNHICIWLSKGIVKVIT
jgi:hypothetical protein